MGTVKTVTEQIYSNIYELILNGTYKPGARLTTKSLQEELGVSSSPIREALTRLQQDGLVDYQPNSGMSVRCYSQDDINNLFSLMADLDMLALQYAIKKSEDMSFINKLKHNVLASSAFLTDSDCEEWCILSDKFHTIIADAADNPFLLDSLHKIYMHISIFSKIYESNINNRNRIQDDHEKIVNLLENGKYEEAIKRYREHVIASMNEVIISM